MSQDNNSKIDMGTDPVFKKLLFYIRVLESMHLLVYVQCVSSLILKSEGPPKGGGRVESTRTPPLDLPLKHKPSPISTISE